MCNIETDNTINIEIDTLSPCLIERITGNIVDTYYSKVNKNESLIKKH